MVIWTFFISWCGELGLFFPKEASCSCRTPTSFFLPSCETSPLPPKSWKNKNYKMTGLECAVSYLAECGTAFQVPSSALLFPTLRPCAVCKASSTGWPLLMTEKHGRNFQSVSRQVGPFMGISNLCVVPVGASPPRQLWIYLLAYRHVFCNTGLEAVGWLNGMLLGILVEQYLWLKSVLRDSS